MENVCVLGTLHSYITPTVFSTNKTSLYLGQVELTSDPDRALSMTQYDIHLEGANLMWENRNRSKEARKHYKLSRSYCLNVCTLEMTYVHFIFL